MDPVVKRLEQLLAERSGLIERHAELWALYGGWGKNWALQLLEIECAPLRGSIRTKLAASNRTVRENDVEEALLSEAQYANGLRAVVAGRVEWAKVKEQMATIQWQLQVEMAKLRLNLGEDASPIDRAQPDDSDG